jgi:hypothetical protein
MKKTELKGFIEAVIIVKAVNWNHVKIQSLQI